MEELDHQEFLKYMKDIDAEKKIMQETNNMLVFYNSYLGMFNNLISSNKNFNRNYK
jgi:hypothetical protein|tara:strand:+ start:488 stop:655 length:168 start_codon:yes stop_codon:yes gene_type:complete